MQNKAHKAGYEAGKEEDADGVDGPAEIFARKDTPVEEQNAELDDGFRDDPAEEEYVEALLKNMNELSLCLSLRRCSLGRKGQLESQKHLVNTYNEIIP